MDKFSEDARISIDGKNVVGAKMEEPDENEMASHLGMMSMQFELKGKGKFTFHLCACAQCREKMEALNGPV